MAIETPFEMARRAERYRAEGLLPITDEMRNEFGATLILQGYGAFRAHEMMLSLDTNDNALQLQARVRRISDLQKAAIRVAVGQGDAERIFEILGMSQ